MCFSFFFILFPYSYFVLCKDFTLRRFHQSEEVDKPNVKNLKVYQLSEFEAVVPDVPPRFFLRLKSKSVDKEGVVIKIAAEFETEKAEWVRELAKAIAECPKDIDDDPVRAALEEKKRKAELANAKKKATAAVAGKKAAAAAEENEDGEDDDGEGVGLSQDGDDDDDSAPTPTSSSKPKVSLLVYKSV